MYISQNILVIHGHWSSDWQVIYWPVQMLVKQRENERQTLKLIQNAEAEKQLQQALNQVSDIGKNLKEIRLCFQTQVSAYKIKLYSSLSNHNCINHNFKFFFKFYISF